MAEYICPHCKNPIDDDEALLCLYCGESLNRSLGVMGKIKFSKRRIAVIGIAALVLLSFLMLVMK